MSTPQRQLKLLLPYPPSVNTYWRRAGTRIYLSPKGRDYRKKVEAVIRERHPQLKAKKCRLSIQVYAWPPDLRVRDIDNFQKSLFDSLAHAGVYQDDSQIHHIEVFKLEKIQPGHIGLLIRPYNRVTPSLTFEFFGGVQ